MDELVKRLRELASIPEHCENVTDCDQCSKEDICLSFTNKKIIEVATQAADAIEELSREAEVNAKRAMKWAFDAEEAEAKLRWIPVTEEPPLKVGDDGYNGYLVYANGYYEVADYTTDKFDDVPYFHVNGEYEPDVTHYMPLPEPPEEE